MAEPQPVNDDPQALFFSSGELTPGARDYLLNLVLTSAPVTLFYIDREGIFRLSTGRGIEVINQLRGTSSAGRSVYELYGEYSEVTRAYKRALAGESFTAVVQLPPLIFETRYEPHRDAEGKVLGVIGVSVDVTKRQAFQEQLFRSEQRLRTIFERAGTGIVVESLDGRMLDCNPAFAEMVGCGREELQKMSYTDITYPEDMAASTMLLARLSGGENDLGYLNKRYVRPDGQVRWGHITASVVRRANGQPDFIIGMVEDDTASKELENELREVQHRLMQSRENERLALAQELHDGPLQDIIGVIYQLQGPGAGQEERLDAVKGTLEELVRRLRAICTELRPPTLTPFGLEKAIRSHAQTFHAEHPELEITLELDNDRLQLPEQTRLALFRVYQEAVNNIVRHSNASRVWVSLALADGQATLEVADDGAGFELPDRLVELVRQGHLGLVGAMERAEAINGRLAVETKPGQGTRVRVTAPLPFPGSEDQGKWEAEKQ